MANTNAPFGLRPVRFANGRPYNGSFNLYFATGATGAIYIGDPVIINGTSNTAAVQGNEAGTLPGVQIALEGANDPITGICVGVLPLTRESTSYRANSTDRIICVADDPDLIFQVQQDAGGAIATTDVGLMVVLGTGSGGSTAYGKSSWVISAVTAPASTAGHQLMLERLAPLPGNEIGDYAVWEVMINNHQRANVGDAGRFTAV
jgi:hypothetical protein